MDINTQGLFTSGLTSLRDFKSALVDSLNTLGLKRVGMVKDIPTYQKYLIDNNLEDNYTSLQSYKDFISSVFAKTYDFTEEDLAEYNDLINILYAFFMLVNTQFRQKGVTVNSIEARDE